MDWFTKLKNALIPSKKQDESEVAQQAQSLTDFVQVTQQQLNTTPVSQTTTARPVTSTLSPFAARILEKAKIESLKDDSERRKATSVADLFLKPGEAKERVGHIESIALERNKRSTNKFTDAARQMPDTKWKMPSFLPKKTEEK